MHLCVPFATTQNKKLVSTCDAKKLSYATIVDSALAYQDMSLVEQVARMLNFSLTLMEKYSISLLKTKTLENIRDMMLFDFLQGTLVSKYRHYMRAGNISMNSGVY